MKILEQIFFVTGICANISIMYIHYKFYKVAYGNDKNFNLKDKNVDISYVGDEEENKKEDITTQTVVDTEDDTTQTVEESEREERQEIEIEDRLRRASDVDEEDVEEGKWAKYLSFGVK